MRVTPVTSALRAAHRTRGASRAAVSSRRTKGARPVAGHAERVVDVPGVALFLFLRQEAEEDLRDDHDAGGESDGEEDERVLDDVDGGGRVGQGEHQRHAHHAAQGDVVDAQAKSLA